MPYTSLNLKSSICSDTPTGSDIFPFDNNPSQVIQNTGIERNGGISALYLQTTTFTTAGANSIITSSGDLLQVDSSHNVRVNDVVIGNVGDCAVYKRGILEMYQDAAWTATGTIIGISKIENVIKVDEYDPFAATITNTRNLTFSSLPSDVFNNVSLVKYVDMAYVDKMEIIVSGPRSTYHLNETGATTTYVTSDLVWTSRTIATFTYAYQLIWCSTLQIFVAIGSASKCFTSYDGITWTSQTIPSSLEDVAYSDSLGIFAAVYGTGGAPTATAASSPDAVTWTARTIPSGEWKGVAWSPPLGMFAAVGLTHVCATSLNGTTWATQTISANGDFYSITWSPELSIFCAVGKASLSGCAVSSDGINWTPGTMPGAATITYNSVAWSPDLTLFAAVGGTISACATSPDGLNWTSRTFPSSNVSWYKVIWVNKLKKFVAVGDWDTIALSSDGINWTTKAITDISQKWRAIAYSEDFNLLVAISENGGSGGSGGIVSSPGLINNINYSWKFAADKYLLGHQGLSGSWNIGSIATLTNVTNSKWAIIDRFPGTAYSRSIITFNPSKVNSTTISGWSVFGYSSAGVWSATQTYYGKNIGASTATLTNAFSGPGYSETSYTISSTIYYYISPQFKHNALSNYQASRSDTLTPIAAYGKLTDNFDPLGGTIISSLVGWRVGIIPIPGDTSGTYSGLPSFISAAPIATSTTFDHIGVPITNVGEFDAEYVPHVVDDASTYSRIIYRFNGVLYYVDVRKDVSHGISKVDDNTYYINCLSAVNCVNMITKSLVLGANDYNGRTIFNSLGTIGSSHKLAATLKSQFASSIDVGDKIITNYKANTSAYIPGIELPAFIDRLIDYGVDVFLDDVYEETYLTYAGYNVDARKSDTLYVADTRLPIAIGYTWQDKAVQQETKTILTGVGVSGQADTDYGYIGYELGNDIDGTFSAFTLFGQRYLCDGLVIWAASFQGPLYTGKAYVCPAKGMTFIAASPTSAYFLSDFDNSLYTFDGGRSLQKVKRLNDESTITDGVFNVRDNTLCLNTSTSFIWMRDGIFSKNTKLATQTGITLYDTQDGIVIANDTVKWIYSFASMSSSTVVSLAWQSAYHGLKGNELSVINDWVITLYSPGGKISASVTLKCYSFDQDQYSVQTQPITINPSDWTDLYFYRCRIQPATPKALASSVEVDTSSHLVINDVSVNYEDEAQAGIAGTRSV